MSLSKQDYKTLFEQLVLDAVDKKTTPIYPIVFDRTKLEIVSNLYADEMIACKSTMPDSLGGDSHKLASGVIKTLINTLYPNEHESYELIKSSAGHVSTLEVTADISFYIACSLCMIDYNKVRNDSDLNNGMLAYLLDIKHNADIFGISLVMYLLEQTCDKKGYLLP